MSNRLKVISSSKHFKSCKCCGFTYLPMTKWAVENCPKCEPMESKTKFVDPDVEYLKGEMLTEESVNMNNMHDGNITYKQLAL